MTERRFHAGETYSIPPMEYRLVNGRKDWRDIRLDWRWHCGEVCTEWRPVELDHVALIVDVIADNENVLYPYPAKGGAYVWAFVRSAFKNGWLQARHDLHLERARRDERREMCS